MNKKLIAIVPVFIIVICAGVTPGVAQSLTKVVMTTGSFSEREAAM